MDYTCLQGKRKGARWAQEYFPARSFVESSDGLYTVRRGEGPPEQVTLRLCMRLGYNWVLRRLCRVMWTTLAKQRVSGDRSFS